MFKAAIKKNVTEKVLMMGELKPCQLAEVIEDHRYNGTIVMKTASNNHFEVMCLSGSFIGDCWTNRKWVAGIKVKLLPKGTKLTLEVV